MSISLSQVLQRVVIDDGTGGAKPMRERVFAVLKVHFEAALDQELERPIGLFISEAARRARKEVRTVQLAMTEAAQLGLIKRVRGIGYLGKKAPWLVLPHPVLILAAQETRPYQGARLVFPRAWNDTSLLHEVQKMQVQKTQGKRFCEHSPPPLSANASREHGALAGLPSAPSGGGGAVLPLAASPQQEAPRKSGSGGETHDHSIPLAKPVSEKVIQKFGHGAGGDAYWSWVQTGCARVGWAGQIRFVQQRRRIKDGERGGQFGERVVSLANAKTGAAATLFDAATTRGDIEVTFQAVDALHPLLLVDDLDATGVELLRTLVPAALVETSPGNYQATVVAPRLLTRAERLAAQHTLAQRLDADDCATSSTQLRRFPGSKNAKPSLPAPFFARLVGEPGVGVVMSVEFLAELLASAGATTTVQRSQGEHGTRALGALGDSELDFGWVLQQIKTRPGVSDGQLELELAARAACRNRHGDGSNEGAPGHVKYAKRTVASARRVLLLRRAA